jgi:hypothetical protein
MQRPRPILTTFADTRTHCKFKDNKVFVSKREVALVTRSADKCRLQFIVMIICIKMNLKQQRRLTATEFQGQAHEPILLYLPVYFKKPFIVPERFG